MKYFFLFLFKLLVIKSNSKFHNYVKKSNYYKMSVKNINREFEVFMRDMMKAQECVQENIETEFRELIRVTVNSCATMYGFSAQEALKRLNSSGEINEVPVLPIQQKETKKSEKLRLKEAEKAEKLRLKEAEKAEKLRLKEAEKALKEAKKEEKLVLKEKKDKKSKKVASDSEGSTVIMSASEDEEPFVRFHNIPLMNEINSIRDVKKNKNWKKLSAGVKLARQILDI